MVEIIFRSICTFTLFPSPQMGLLPGSREAGIQSCTYFIKNTTEYDDTIIRIRYYLYAIWRLKKW